VSRPDTLHDDLAAMFSRRENDTTVPVRMPGEVRRAVRRRQGIGAIAACAIVGAVALGGLSAVRTIGGAWSASPAGWQPSAAPGYAPPSHAPIVAPDPIPMAAGRTPAFRWRVLGSGDPGPATITVLVQTAPADAGPWRTVRRATLDRLSDPLDYQGLRLRGASGESLVLTWGPFVLGNARVRLDLGACGARVIARSQAAQVGPTSEPIHAWALASPCAPTKIGATTILGGDLGVRRIPGSMPGVRV
jgi:hypothetical protein